MFWKWKNDVNIWESVHCTVLIPLFSIFMHGRPIILLFRNCLGESDDVMHWKKISVNNVETDEIFSLSYARNISFLSIISGILSQTPALSMESSPMQLYYLFFIPNIYILHQQFSRQHQCLWLYKMPCTFTMVFLGIVYIFVYQGSKFT